MRNQQHGSLSIEFLLAVGLFGVLMSTAIRSVVVLQDAVVYAALASEARGIAERDVARVQHYAGPLHQLPVVVVEPGPFTQGRIFMHSTLCTASVMSRVSWPFPHQSQVEFVAAAVSSTSVTDSGLDCPAAGLLSSFTTPVLESSIALPTRPRQHGIDVVTRQGKRLAVAVSSSTQVGDVDVTILDITQFGSPTVLGQLHTGSGLFAVDVAGNFAYAVQNSSALQLQVIDISNPASPLLVAARSLPGTTGSFPQGRSIFVFRNRVYVGTYETAGPEFHVFDITNPNNPQFLGSRAVNHSIRNIIVREELLAGNVRLVAYLASSANTAELSVLDVTNPAGITILANVDLPGSSSATALYAAGPHIWVARQQAVGEPSIAAVTVADPAAPTIASTFNAQLKSGSVINGLALSNGVLAIATTDTTAPFLLCAVADDKTVQQCAVHMLFSEPGRIDVQDGRIFVPAGNRVVVIKDGA